MTELLSGLRAVNCPLISWALVWLVIRLADIWPTMRLGRRLVMQGVVLFMLAGVVGSAIKYLNHTPVDVSVAIVTLAAIVTLLGLWLSRHDVAR